MEIISWKAAKAAGRSRYFTGKPCKRGHVDERFVASYACVICARHTGRDIYRRRDEVQRKAIYESRREYLQTWKAANRERKLALDVAANKRFKERQPEYFREYYANRKEQRRAEARAWYHANKERATAKNRECLLRRKAAHPEHVRSQQLAARHRRMARERNAFVEDVQPLVVFERDRGICGICHAPVDRASRWEIDHIVPVSKGGEHSYANVQLAHRRCNRAKWASLWPLTSSPSRPPAFTTAPAGSGSGSLSAIPHKRAS